jgi:Peroxidase
MGKDCTGAHKGALQGYKPVCNACCTEVKYFACYNDISDAYMFRLLFIYACVAAWHDSGTFNKDLNTGGANGTIRFEKEITAPPNAGLDSAIKLVTEIKNKYPEVTWADLYQLGSAAAITVRPNLRCSCQHFEAIWWQRTYVQVYKAVLSVHGCHTPMCGRHTVGYAASAALRATLQCSWRVAPRLT